ncbi:MAG TPA: D-alanine--D-alanine ligase [Polyangiaceae bacterium]
MNSLSVWVICGGPSGEAEVSRTSGRGVVAALTDAGHAAKLVEFEPALALALLQDRPDVVFPVTHGTLGEDGCLQGLLEVFAMPYVGSGVLASAVGAQKPVAKGIWRSGGLPVAEEALVRRGDNPAQLVGALRARLGRAVVVKPASGGSAIGVQRVASSESDERLVGAILDVLDIDDQALVEQWLEGIEVTCGVLEIDGRATALPPTQIQPNRADFYDFVSKYAPGGSRHLCPAPLPPPCLERIQALAVRAHELIQARDLSRVDFIVGENGDGERQLTILEINTLPGMTPTSLYPEAAAVGGVRFTELVDSLVRQAMARPRRVVPEVLGMPA